MAVSPCVWAQSNAHQAEAAAEGEYTAVDRAEHYLTRGLARATLGLKNEALADLTLAINQRALSARHQAQALYNRGLLLEEMSDAKNAAADYMGALSLDPGLEQASARLNVLNKLLSSSSQQRSRTPSAQFISSSVPFLKPAIPERSEETLLEVQLGARRTRAEANDEWNEIRARAGDLLQEFTPNIFEADVPGKGRYFRLRLGPMNKKTATQLCSELKSRGLACISVDSF
jgi:tetratricopeptide (TPR) repeat protein